jgi:hypothetical protein
LLRWEQKELAKQSGISLPTIGRLESKPGKLEAYARTVSTLRGTLEAHGIEFYNGNEPGVRLRVTKGKARAKRV